MGGAEGRAGLAARPSLPTRGQAPAGARWCPPGRGAGGAAGAAGGGSQRQERRRLPARHCGAGASGGVGGCWSCCRAVRGERRRGRGGGGRVPAGRLFRPSVLAAAPRGFLRCPVPWLPPRLPHLRAGSGGPVGGEGPQSGSGSGAGCGPAARTGGRCLAVARSRGPSGPWRPGLAALPQLCPGHGGGRAVGSAVL